MGQGVGDSEVLIRSDNLLDFTLLALLAPASLLLTDVSGGAQGGVTP